MVEDVEVIEFKQTELGAFPEDWVVCEFKDVLEGFSSGQTPYRAISRYYKGNIPWITSGELNYNVIYDTHEKITEEAVVKTNLKIIPEGTFLFAITGLEAEGTRGRCALTGVKATTNQSCMALYPKGEITTEYLLWFYKMFSEKLALTYCQGTKQQSYTGGIAKKLPIALPPTKAEQTAIAKALNDADELLNQLEKLIAKKRAIKQGAMQELLKPKEGWEVKKLGEIGDCIIGLTYSPANVRKEGTLVLRSSNIQGNKLAYEDNVFVNVDVPEKLLVRRGDILICVRNGSRNLIGKCAYIDGRAVGETFGAFMSVFRSIHNSFVFHVLQSYYIQRQIEETIGATINQLTNKNLNSFEIPFPSKEEQTRISTILAEMDAEISVLEQKLEKQKLLKQGMMQVLLTGKIRLI